MSFKKRAKQLCLVTLTATFAFSTTGCNEGDVAAGVIIGGIVGGIIGGIDGDYDDGPRCHGGYRTECREWRDRWGDWRRECREVYDDCIDYYASSPESESDFLQELGLVSAESSSSAVHEKVAHLAEKLGLGFTAAERVQQAMDLAQAGDLAGLKALGLDKAALSRIGQLQMPNSSSVQVLASALNIQQQQAQSLLREILQETKSQAEDIASPLWQTCVASGTWKTPQNQFCQKSYWSGCSPETGASLCVPAN